MMTCRCGAPRPRNYQAEEDPVRQAERASSRWRQGSVPSHLSYLLLRHLRFCLHLRQRCTVASLCCRCGHRVRHNRQREWRCRHSICHGWRIGMTAAEKAEVAAVAGKTASVVKGAPIGISTTTTLMAIAVTNPSSAVGDGGHDDDDGR